jgi:hypothetical protein
LQACDPCDPAAAKALAAKALGVDDAVEASLAPALPALVKVSTTGATQRAVPTTALPLRRVRLEKPALSIATGSVPLPSLMIPP